MPIMWNENLYLQFPSQTLETKGYINISIKNLEYTLVYNKYINMFIKNLK